MLFFIHIFKINHLDSLVGKASTFGQFLSGGGGLKSHHTKDVKNGTSSSDKQGCARKAGDIVAVLLKDYH